MRRFTHTFPQRISAFLLCLALLIGLLPTSALAAGLDTEKAIQLADSGTAANISGGQVDSIYFGTYQQSSNGNDGYNIDPIKWRVLENAGGHLFLLSDQNLDVFQYHTDWEEITWERSTMRSWLNGYGASENAGGDSGTDYTSDNFIGAAFSEKEQKAIAETTVVNNDNPNHNTDGGNNTTDKIFLLSIAEANNGSYFADDSSRISTNTAYVADGGKIGGDMFSAGKGDWWWLRSPGSDDHSAAGVAGNGDVDNAGVHGDDEDRAVRPAFHLDLNSVLFTSAAVGGKAGDGLNAVANYDGNEWKLTLLDNSRNFSISDAKTNGSGDTIVFFYSDAQTGTNEYISIVIEDNGAITYYGRILQLDGTTNGSSGTTSLTLPDGVTLGDTTKLYVFNEQYNGDKMTDYASQLKEISSPTVDTTAPTLSNGSATRTGETTATVKFTSDEAGSYYYVVDNNATAPDSIDTTTTAGTSCKANEETEISLDSLSGEYIHIVVKDAANNVSDILTIQIPAYTFTVTVNVDPSNGGTASADPSAAVEGDEIELTASPNEGYHFKEWQVTPNTVSIGNDDKFTMPAGDVTVKAVFEAHSFTQKNTNSEYLASSATCTQAATYYKSCSCGAKGTETFTSGEALGHTPEADWKYNDSNHWKECVSCGAKVDEAAHVYDNEQDITCDLCGYVKPTYAISASPGTLDFGSEAEGYADAPAAQIVTITNIGNQSVTVNLPTSTKYIITAGTGFENGTATLALDGTATFTVQPKTGLAIGSQSETLNISGSDGTSASASVKLSFTVNAVYTLTVNLNGGSGSTTGDQYPAGKVAAVTALRAGLPPMAAPLPMRPTQAPPLPCPPGT